MHFILTEINSVDIKNDENKVTSLLQMHAMCTLATNSSHFGIAIGYHLSYHFLLLWLDEGYGVIYNYDDDYCIFIKTTNISLFWVAPA